MELFQVNWIKNGINQVQYTISEDDERALAYIAYKNQVYLNISNCSVKAVTGDVVAEQMNRTNKMMAAYNDFVEKYIDK